jgi:hypothetical protein
MAFTRIAMDHPIDFFFRTSFTSNLHSAPYDIFKTMQTPGLASNQNVV